MKYTRLYWGAVYEIYRDRLWDAEYESQADWIGSFSVEPFGPSRSMLMQVMQTFDALTQNGLTLPQARDAVGSGKTAILHDLSRLFNRVGRRTFSLKASVRRQMKGRSLAQVVDDLSQMGDGAARAEVGSFLGQHQVFCIDRVWSGRSLLIRLAEKNANGRNYYYDVVIRLSRHSPAVESYLEKKFNPVE